MLSAYPSPWFDGPLMPELLVEFISVFELEELQHIWNITVQ